MPHDRPEQALAAYDRNDFITIVQIVRPLALKGEAWAQSLLATMYYEGKGVAQDYVKAHSWYNLGAIKGDADAVKNRDIVAKRMTSQQIAEAQKMARDCQARNFKGCD